MYDIPNRIYFLTNELYHTTNDMALAAPFVHLETNIYYIVAYICHVSGLEKQ